MTEEQRKEFLARIEECQENDDTEVAHIKADGVYLFSIANS